MSSDQRTNAIGNRGEAADELYVGYLPSAPPHTARFLRRLVPALAIGPLLLAALLATLQARFDPGVFEYGTTRAVEGTLYDRPYPLLVGSDPGPGGRAALLVGEGKHGAGPDAAGLAGRRVRLEATRIESPLGSMLELVPETLEPVAASPAGAEGFAAAEPPVRAPGERGVSLEPEVLGRVEVSGEIVDSKCFLGVMKPGQGKPHRSCAARCLSGGIPPQLLVESADGSQRLLLLADADGGALDPASFLDLVGEAVTARGTVERAAGLLVLRVDEQGLRRAGGK